MTFFADLSVYQYLPGADDYLADDHSHRRVELTYPRVNIGWLAEGRPFATGPAPEGLVDALLDVIAEQRVNLTRGFEMCGFCPRGAAEMPGLARDGRRLDMGNGEIRVPTPEGVVLAAPTLIGHYVAAHGYLPPDVFTNALIAFRRDFADRLATGWIPSSSEL